MLSQYRSAVGCFERVEDVVTGGSTAFKVKERQPQALGSVGLTDASGFLEQGKKRVDSVLVTPGRLPEPDMQQCGTFQDTVTAPSTHFCRIGLGDQMAGSCLPTFIALAQLCSGSPRSWTYYSPAFWGQTNGPSPWQNGQRLIRSFDPAPFP